MTADDTAGTSEPEVAEQDFEKADEDEDFDEDEKK